MSIIPKALLKFLQTSDDYDREDRLLIICSKNNGSGKPSLWVKEIGKIFDIPIADIRTNPSQPRKVFSPEQLTSLAKSISQDGIIQPLSVRRVEGGFELISGERRLRAAKMAGMLTVPCILINADQKRSAVMSLIENIQRSQLNFFEEAQALDKLIKTFGLTQEEVAVRLGLAQSTVANKLRLLRLTRRGAEHNHRARAFGAARKGAAAGHGHTAAQGHPAKAVNGGWTVTQLEGCIKKLEEQELHRRSIRKSAVLLRDVKMFFNTVNKAVDVMRLAGVDTDTQRIDHEDYIEYIIKIASKACGITGENPFPKTFYCFFSPFGNPHLT